MNTKLEVQLAIKQLSKDEIRNLAKWLEEYIDEKCDRQIDLDVGLEVKPAVIEQLLAIRQSIKSNPDNRRGKTAAGIDRRGASDIKVCRYF